MAVVFEFRRLTDRGRHRSKLLQQSIAHRWFAINSPSTLADCLLPFWCYSCKIDFIGVEKKTFPAESPTPTCYQTPVSRFVHLEPFRSN